MKHIIILISCVLFCCFQAVSQTSPPCCQSRYTISLKAELDTLEDLAQRYIYQDTSINVNITNTFDAHIDTFTNVLTAGRYLVTWGYSFNQDATTADFISKLEIDGQVRGSGGNVSHAQEVKDAANGAFGQVPGSGTGQRLSFMKSLVIIWDAEISHTLNLSHRTETVGIESTIFDAFIKVEKISNL